jgi:hypothetical protein
VFAIPAAIMSSAFTDQLRAEREEALKLEQAQSPSGHDHDVQLMASNPEFALARYRTLLNQMREVAALSDHAHISQRLADAGQTTEHTVWQSLKQH